MINFTRLNKINRNFEEITNENYNSYAKSEGINDIRCGYVKSENTIYLKRLLSNKILNGKRDLL